MVHAHSPGLIAFAASGAPSRAVYLVVGSLAAGVPVTYLNEREGKLADGSRRR